MKYQRYCTSYFSILCFVAVVTGLVLEKTVLNFTENSIHTSCSHARKYKKSKKDEATYASGSVKSCRGYCSHINNHDRNVVTSVLLA